MSTETVTTPQETAKQEFTSGLDRLSNDDLFKGETTNTATTTTEVKGGSTLPNDIPTQNIAEKATETELKDEPSLTEQEALKAEAKALNLPETATKEEIEAAKIAKPADEKKDEGFEETEATPLSAEEGTWKAILEERNIPIPEDFTEEKGFDIVLEAEKAKIHEEYKEQLAITAEEILSPYPPEARLILDLMAAGQTLEEINKPINQINAWKGMSKEELVRENLTGLGYTEEEVDHKMEGLISGNKLDVEHQILMKEIAQMEKRINTQREQQLNQYKAAQAQLKEQKKAQDFNAFKTALDRMPTFMDRKLADANKQSILTDYNNGAFERLMQNPVEKAEFMLYKKYGKQALKYAQDRAIEQATLEKAKSQHNVPPVTSGNSNNTNVTTNTNKSGIDRLADDFPTN